MNGGDGQHRRGGDVQYRDTGCQECGVDKTVLLELIWNNVWPDGPETSTAREERRGSCGGRPVYEFV